MRASTQSGVILRAQSSERMQHQRVFQNPSSFQQVDTSDSQSDARSSMMPSGDPAPAMHPSISSPIDSLLPSVQARAAGIGAYRKQPRPQGRGGGICREYNHARFITIGSFCTHSKKIGKPYKLVTKLETSDFRSSQAFYRITQRKRCLGSNRMGMLEQKSY